ncbi:hypothetical protein CBR61_07020 [Porphyrobacter sp. CACIAM 03H1]|nr:hypothetical protein CBR61_07020 [Porphyrobacter sp. CACIAM 03H1]
MIERPDMKTGFATSGLLALVLLAGCGEGPAGDVEDQPAARERGTQGGGPAPSGATRPVLNSVSYPPRDDCAALPGWTEFRGKLEAAVARRDADALAALVDPDIRLDFGGGAGVKELRRRLDDPGYRLWDEIAALLPLGCGQQDGGAAAMPWIFANTPADADAYRGMLTLGPAVPAYPKPDAGSPASGQLNWAIVDFAEGSEGPGKSFTQIVLPGGGGTAFVETAKLRSLIDYRLLATDTKQGWRITALIAGD